MAFFDQVVGGDYTGVTYLIMAYLEPMAYYIGRTYVVRAYFD